MYLSCNQECQRIYFEDFAKAFAVFRPISSKTAPQAVNSREAKIRYLFNLVDLNQDGKFTADELHDLLEQMMGAKVE